ncbi:2'-5' RNA ligase family protein [Asaia sp. BMEF1]|uniref:2'-5' RNA ligase family protein n=1 Tax=unclassified Asaia TaxID=2685023 RepID=UPI00301674A2
MNIHPDAPLILTLELAPEEQAWAQAQRDLYFPRDRNIVPAHVTLFHALPAAHEPTILEVIRRTRPAPLIRIGAPFLLGRGVAYRLLCSDGAEIREAVCACLPKDCLTRQDQAVWKPHLTVQNKVSPQEAQVVYAQLASEPARQEKHAAALNLWRYLGGPWEKVARVPFAQPNTD